MVDATGNAAAIQEGLSLVRRAGTFAVFGVSHAAAKGRDFALRHLQA